MNNYFKQYKYISICILFLIVCMVPSVRNVHASEPNHVDSVLKISPVILKIRLAPGSKQIHIITVENRTSSPMPIRATVEGFDPSDEKSGYSPTKSSGSISPLSQWISIQNAESIIPAKSSQEFSVSIAIPKTVPIGGYYAMIYFSPLYPGTSVTSKIGVITLANIGVQDSIHNKAVISDFSFDTPLYEKNPLTAHIRITNDSLHYFSAKPTLTIAPIWGKSDSVELDEKIILPGKSRLWKSVFSIQNSKWGIYNATLSVSLEQGQRISKTIQVAVLPIRLFLSILIAILFCLFIWNKRKNIRKALFILFFSTESEDKPLPVYTHPKPEYGFANSVGTGVDGQLKPSRIDPHDIIESVQRHGGSISLAAKELGLNRSTVYRWVQSNRKTRKSTKPHSTRTSTLSPDVIDQIIHARHVDQLTVKEIVQKLNLVVSPRTVHRVLQTHHVTKTRTKI